MNREGLYTLRTIEPNIVANKDMIFNFNDNDEADQAAFLQFFGKGNTLKHQIKSKARQGL